jgi:hypothetical protein
MADNIPGLDDPDYAAFAWRRYRRIMAWMTLASLAGGVIAAIALNHFYGPLSIAAILGGDRRDWRLAVDGGRADGAGVPEFGKRA